MKTIPLTQGYFTKVDDDDYKKYAIYRWCVSISYSRGTKSIRAIRKEYSNKYKKGKTRHLSRVILNALKGKNVDHINGDTLDNRKSNLRLCTSGENIRNQVKRCDNTSGYKGVSWSSEREKWEAKIQLNNKTIHLGRYKNKKEAAQAYNNAAIKYHKNFARLNDVG